jgi:hypothetical protein
MITETLCKRIGVKAVANDLKFAGEIVDYLAALLYFCGALISPQ